MFEKSYVRLTGQMWKIFLFAAAPVAGIVLVVIGFTLASDQAQALAILLVLSGIGLGLMAFLWISLTLKCPQCHTRLLLKAMKQSAHQNWLAWLLNLRSCPV